MKWLTWIIHPKGNGLPDFTLYYAQSYIYLFFLQHSFRQSCSQFSFLFFCNIHTPIMITIFRYVLIVLLLCFAVWIRKGRETLWKMGKVANDERSNSVWYHALFLWQTNFIGANCMMESSPCGLFKCHLFLSSQSAKIGSFRTPFTLS